MDVIDHTTSIEVGLGEIPPQPPVEFNVWILAIPVGIGLLYYLLRGKK